MCAFTPSQLSQCSKLTGEARPPGGGGSEAFVAAALKQVRELRRSSDGTLQEAVRDRPELRSAFERCFLEVQRGWGGGGW